ncbi:MAG: DNA repair protein [Anaerovoracaceae bacterium]
MYLCIDLKSFYASVECVERGLDPMETNLVVADPERNRGTICLAITPAMKALGIKNRCRIFEIPSNVKYIVAPPRMKKYIDYSADIYDIYLDYVSKEDIHVYSIDEAFLDITNYLELYKSTPEGIGKRIMDDIYSETGIKSSCGVGNNLYLSKIALDITAKKSKDGIGVLDEQKYIDTLWNHRPLTDFWRIGRGTAQRLYRYGIVTMEQVAKADETLLYKVFGKDAELLIDHAWGIETVTMEDIKKYRPKSHSLSSGQVLMRDYQFDEGLLIVKEMMDLLSLDLVGKELVTSSITLHIGYTYKAKIKSTHGSVKTDVPTNSDLILISKIAELYLKIVDRKVPIRRITISCNNIEKERVIQTSIFDEYFNVEQDRDIQKVVNNLKDKFGKNSIMKGMNLSKAATTLERNRQIGGHKSGE